MEDKKIQCSPELLEWAKSIADCVPLCPHCLVLRDRLNKVTKERDYYHGEKQILAMDNAVLYFKYEDALAFIKSLLCKVQ